MIRFGIRFSDELKGSVETPEGFRVSEISLGDHVEICFSDCSKWSPDDYVRHWTLSAEELLEQNTPKLFCSSLEMANAELWIGIPKLKHVVFYNKISKASDLNVNNLTISWKRSFAEYVDKPSPKWSCWKVPLTDLKRFADGKH